MEDGADFYTNAGGALPLDGTTGVPVFDGDIVVRGGKMMLSLTNQSTDDAVLVKIWILWSVKNPNFTNFPTTLQVGDTPDVDNEFRALYGRMYPVRQMMLEPLTSIQVEKRIPIMKIDRAVWSIDGGHPYWIIFIANLKDTTSAAVTQISSFNLSFVGDALTPT